MSSPASPEHGTLFDLTALERELRSDGAYERNGHTARTLTRTADLRVVLIAMRVGARMPEHQANETASIQAMSGQVELKLPDRKLALTPGSLIVLAAGLRHALEAKADSSLLLTIGWQNDR